MPEREIGGHSGFARHVGQNSGVSLARLSWLIVTLVCLIAAVILLVEDYTGYFGVLLAVAAAAAINLR